MYLVEGRCFTFLFCIFTDKKTAESGVWNRVGRVSGNTAILFYAWSLMSLSNKGVLFSKYSRLSLSRLRLFRMTANLEMKIWCLFKHETLTTSNKIMWKRRSNFSSFPHYFQYISNFRSQITYSFMKCGCSVFSLHFCKSDNYVEVRVSRSITESPQVDCICTL